MGDHASALRTSAVACRLAHVLAVLPGSPLPVERRVIADPHGRPIETTESRYPADRYALDVRFDVEGHGSGSGGAR